MVQKRRLQEDSPRVRSLITHRRELSVILETMKQDRFLDASQANIESLERVVEQLNQQIQSLCNRRSQKRKLN